jgi:hypothetical protein
MKRVLEQNASFDDQCKAASESLVLLSRVWNVSAKSSNFSAEQVIVVPNGVFLFLKLAGARFRGEARKCD